MTKTEPRMVSASLDFCLANLNFPSSLGTSLPSEAHGPLLAVVHRVHDVHRTPVRRSVTTAANAATTLRAFQEW